jgi:hypothetical protein
MAVEHHISGEVESKTDLERVCLQICREVEQADARPALTELYRRAGYLVTLTHSPAWEKNFGAEVAALRELAKDEFRKTARKIKHRANQICTEASCDETGGLKRGSSDESH